MHERVFDSRATTKQRRMRECLDNFSRSLSLSLFFARARCSHVISSPFDYAWPRAPLRRFRDRYTPSVYVYTINLAVAAAATVTAAAADFDFLTKHFARRHPLPPSPLPPPPPPSSPCLRTSRVD